MNKTVLASLTVLIILSSFFMMGLAFYTYPVEASETIYIRIDGSVDPPTAPISSVDNVTYVFTDNISESIVVERSNIIIDGAGYTVEGVGSGRGLSLSSVSNVTIKKANIKSFYYGVYLNFTSSSSILENNISANSYDGVRLEQSSGNTIYRNNATGNGNDGIKLWNGSNINTVSENEVTGNNNDGIQLNECSNNSVHENNIMANSYDGVRIRYSSNNDVYGNKIAESRYGIEILALLNDSFSENNIIHGNNITANSLCGIYLDSSLNNNIVGNTIANNYDGVDLKYSSSNTISENNITVNESYGVWLENSPNTTIRGNSITANGDVGIYIRYSSYNRVSGNDVENNYYGIWLSGSSNTEISENNVRNNHDGVGLVFGSSNDKLYHNNLINNTQQASSTSANSWDDGLEGNYWSDYVGFDLDKDGIGDSPHIIAAGNVDTSPLMGIFSSFNASREYNVKVISNSTIDDFEFSKSPANITIKMHVSNMTSNQTSGFCRVSIPHALMTEPYDVTINGAEPDYANYTIHDNATHRWMYFSYNHSTLEVIIQGTDITPPAISILSPENKTYPTEDVPLNFTIDELPSWIGYSLDGEANVTISSNTTLSSLSDGTHSIVVFANDTFGNMGNSSTVSFLVDVRVRVDIMKHTGYLDSSGYYNVVGEVENVGDQAVNFVQVEATFYNSSDFVVDSRFDLTLLYVLLVGRKSPFHIALLDTVQSAKVDYYSLDVTFVECSPIPLGLQILSNSSYVDEFGCMHIVGEIKNIANETATGVKLIATYYDATGEVVAAMLAYLHPELPADLDPDQTEQFEILLDDEERTQYIDTYELTAESTQYALALEAPTPPEVLVLSPENKTYSQTDLPLTFAVDEPTSWIGYSLDGQANVTVVGNTTLTALLDGSHYVAVYANDTMGNMGASSIVYFTVDSTPPNITEVSQIPPGDNVMPKDQVKVNATITDNLSGVKQVLLNYTNGNGTWIIKNMTNFWGNLWNGTIPAFDYCTYVNYTIIAEDAIGNVITTEETCGYSYQYHVVPEFQSLIILQLLMMATLLTVLAYKHKKFVEESS